MLFITLQDVCLSYMYDNYLVSLYWHKANSASKIVATHKAVKQFLKREVGGGRSGHKAPNNYFCTEAVVQYDTS